MSIAGFVGKTSAAKIGSSDDSLILKRLCSWISSPSTRRFEVCSAYFG